MKFKLMSATIVSVTLLATVSLMPSGGWAQDSQSDAAAAVKVSPATGIAGILVTTASSCPNVACETGDTCQFNLITGTSTNFSRFGATLGKASLLGCVAINQNTGVSVGSGASGDTNCFPATGTVILTQNSKAAGAVTIAFAGNVCELPTAPTKQVLDGAYIVTGSTIKNLNSGSGSISAGYDTVTGVGDLSFQGVKD